MLKIITFPDPILTERMPDFDFSNPIIDPVSLEKEMIEAMFANKGIGLSANQVGIRARVFVMGYIDVPDQARAFFNPEIVANTDQVIDFEEGCLSFPNIYVKLKRPASIKVKYQNSKGEEQFAILENLECRCFLHEFDHLEGITFQNRASTLKWALAVKKSQKRKYR
jgi:peptide deformylase